MEPRLSMITLGVADVKKSTVFYRKLGFPLSKHSMKEISFFELKGTWLALYPKKELAKDAHVAFGKGGHQSVTLAHNVRSKKEADEVFRQAKKAGATVVKPLQDVFWGGYSGYFKDPDGYLWEVAWNPHFWVG